MAPNYLKAKLRVYEWFCLPQREYPLATWGANTKKDINDIESVKNYTTHSTRNTKERDRLDEAKQRMGIGPLAERRKSRRVNLLMTVLSSTKYWLQDTHPALSTERRIHILHSVLTNTEY